MSATFGSRTPDREPNSNGATNILSYEKKFLRSYFVWAKTDALQDDNFTCKVWRLDDFRISEFRLRGIHKQNMSKEKEPEVT